MDKEQNYKCPICNSTNTNKGNYLPGYKCNNCGYHFYIKIEEVKND